MLRIESEITEETLDKLIIQDLECHMEMTDDEEVRNACEVMLNFYKKDETQSTYIYGNYDDLTFKSYKINGIVCPHHDY